MLKSISTKARHLGEMAAAIVHDRSQARHVVPFMRTRGRSTLDLRLPWLPFDLIEHLRGSVRGSRVFEFGGGGSTAWFIDQGSQVMTVEHNEEWMAALKDRLPSADIRFQPATDDYAGYVTAIDDFDDGYFDLVVVDGRARVRCAQRSIPKLRPGGSLVLDDIQREGYAPVFEILGGWAYTRFDGFAPCKPGVAHSGLWVKPEATR